MPPFTKKAIIDSFLSLAAKKNFDKITVRDIVDDCGINRTTFYYYYQDIYAILEELVAHFFEGIAEDPRELERWGEALEELFHFCALHRRAVRSIYTSLGYDELDRYISRAGSKYMREFILSRADGHRKISEKNLFVAEMVMRKAAIGLFSEWIKQDFKPELMPDRGEILRGLDRCAQMAVEFFTEK